VIEDGSLQCPECDYHTLPLVLGRLPSTIKEGLIIHMRKRHGYDRQEALAKLKDLGYVVEGDDLEKFKQDFEKFIGGSL
jgi:hypothetical protein